MDQTTTLSDVLQKGSSLLSGLLSQTGSSPNSGAAQNNLFSNLISTDGLQGAYADQTQTTSSAGASSYSPAASMTSSEASSSSHASSSAQVLKNIADLRSTLHKAQAILHRQSAHASSDKKGNAAAAHAAQTQNASTQTKDQTAQTPTQSDVSESCETSTYDSDASASTDASTETSDSTPTILDATSTDATQSADASDASAALSDILIELLALIQLVIQGLPQTQTASGGTSATEAEAAALEAAASSASMTLGDELLAETVSTVEEADENALDLPDGPLISLLKTIEKNAQKLLAANSEDSLTETSTVSSVASTSDTTISDALAQLSQLDTKINDIIAALQQQTQNSRSVKTSEIPAQVAASTPKTAKSDAATLAMAQSQNLTAASGTASETQTAPTASPSLGAGGMAFNFGDKGNSPTDSDLMSGGGRSFSFAETNSTMRSGVASEGVQATGTYSFASTLSAFRAANGGAVGLPSVVDQVVLQMHRSVKNGQSQVSLQLQPGDLGKITVKLDFDSEGKVQGSVTAENPKTLELLQKDSRSLERALQDAGLRADPGSLQFSLGGQNKGSGQTDNNPANASMDGTLSASDTGDTELVDIGAISETYYLTPNGVNIRV